MAWTFCAATFYTKLEKFRLTFYAIILQSIIFSSESAFRAMDRNKDGYITKGELKLAKKKMTMKEVDQVIKEYDIDQDGKLNYEEFLKSKK